MSQLALEDESGSYVQVRKSPHAPHPPDGPTAAGTAYDHRRAGEDSTGVGGLSEPGTYIHIYVDVCIHIFIYIYICPCAI